MPIVTLTTDFGLQDYYVAVVKGALLSQHEPLNIVDITHQVKSYDIVQAAFVLKNAWTNFPDGTIHIVSVNNFYSHNNTFIAIRHQGHYFIGPDNGVFSLVFDVMPQEIYELEYTEFTTFPLKEVFGRAVWHIASGRPFHEIGIPLESITQRISLQPVIGHSQIRGTVIHTDHYENVITNITRDVFDRVAHGRPFELYFKRHDPISRLSNYYHDVPVGETLCLFNSARYLEIAINMGKAASMLGLKEDDAVQLDFFTPAT